MQIKSITVQTLQMRLELRARFLSEASFRVPPTGTPELAANLANARRTRTGRAVVDAAAHFGVPIRVLFGAEDARAIVCELTPAIVADAIRSSLPQNERIVCMRDLFKAIGLDPLDGGHLARATQGWRDDAAARNVAAAILTRDFVREQEGLPREARDVRDAIIRRAAERENGLALLARRRGPQPLDNQRFLAAWAATPQGRSRAPQGANQRERAAWLDDFLLRFTDPAYLESAV